ncbi:MAG: ABC transporter permease [Gemmatimonadales bacterium]
MALAQLDYRSALRQLRRRPAFALTALVTIALGVGATTAVFSVVNSVLLQPLPYPEPDRLVAIWPAQAVANREIAALRERSESYSQVSGWSPGWLMPLTGVEVPRQLSATRVTADFFPMIGLEPAIGRLFERDAERPGSDQVALLSDHVWRDSFDADPALVGRSISLNGRPVTVVGVMPPGAERFAGRATDFWMPLTMDPSDLAWAGAVSMVYGRLAPSRTIESATAELTTLLGRMRSEFEHPADWARGAAVVELKADLLGDLGQTVWLLFGAVAFLLLIAAANVANLLLVRTAEREQELAVRLSLGATAGQVARLVLREAMLLGLAGGALGVAAAFAGVRLIRAVLPPDLPRLETIGLDGRVLGLAVLASLVTALGFGLLPAFHATRARTRIRSLRSTRATGGGRRTRGALVAVEVALTLVLLVGAGLMTRTLSALHAVDPGIGTDHLLTAVVQPVGMTSADQRRAFYRDALERIEATPGVEAAGTVLHLPMAGREWTAPIEVEGRPLAPGSTPPMSVWQSVSDGYFRAARIALVGGRGFGATDQPDGPPVAVVNEELAAELFPGEDPIGRRIKAGYASRDGWVTIVGVVRGVRSRSLRSAPAPELYLPATQRPMGSMSLIVRTTGDPVAMADLVRERIWSVAPNTPIERVRSMDALVATTLGEPRMILTLLGVFAAIGLALAGVGIYGVVSYGVRQRIRELGIRAALGADAARVIRLVVMDGVRAATLGLLIGVPAALALSRLMTQMVFGVSTADPLLYLLAPVVLVVAAALASWAPARRAARVDPVTVLRE